MVLCLYTSTINHFSALTKTHSPASNSDRSVSIRTPSLLDWQNNKFYTKFGHKKPKFRAKTFGSLFDTIDSNQISFKGIKICNFRRIVWVYVGILVKNRILGQIWAQNGVPKFLNHSEISSLVLKYHWKQSEYAIPDKSSQSKSRYEPKTSFWAKFRPKMTQIWVEI